MRSLWRVLALQWLGGDGSEALTADSAILEGLLRDDARPTRAFEVRRDTPVSRQAMMSAVVPQNSDHSFDDPAAEEVLRSGPPVRYPR